MDLLSRATRASSELPSGYVLDEIVRMSYASPAASAEVLDFLDNALSHQPKVSGENDALQKLNTLRVIRHLCERGSSEFRFGMQRRSVVLKGFLSYRAAPDALRGEAPSREVRLEAQRCLTALFETPKADCCRATARVRAMEGFGSDTLYGDRQDEGHSSNSIGGNTLSRATAPTTSFSSNSSLMPSTMKHAYHPDSGSVSASAPSGLLGGHVSEAMAAHAGQLIRQISIAASSISKFLPSSVRQHLEQAQHQPQQFHQHQFHQPQEYPTNRFHFSSATAFPPKVEPPNERLGITTPGQAGDWQFSSQPTTYSKDACQLESASHPSSPMGTSFASVVGYMSSYEGPNSENVPTRTGFTTGEPPTEAQSTISAGDINIIHGPGTSHTRDSGTCPSVNTQGFVALENPASTLCSHDMDELKKISREIELLCAESASARPAPARSALISFSRMCCDTPKVPIIPLLLSKLSTKIQHPIAQQQLLPTANCWQAKLRVLAALAALIDPQIVSSCALRETYREEIQSFGREPILLLRLSTPKCRQFADRLLEAVDFKGAAEKPTSTPHNQIPTKCTGLSGETDNLIPTASTGSVSCKAVSLLDDYEECISTWKDNPDTLLDSRPASSRVTSNDEMFNGPLLRDLDVPPSADINNEVTISAVPTFSVASKDLLPGLDTKPVLIRGRDAATNYGTLATQNKEPNACPSCPSTAGAANRGSAITATAPLLHFLQCNNTSVEAEVCRNPPQGEPPLLALLTSQSFPKQDSSQVDFSSPPILSRPSTTNESSTTTDDILLVTASEQTAISSSSKQNKQLTNYDDIDRTHNHLQSSAVGNKHAGNLLLQELFPLGQPSIEPWTSQWNL